MNNNILEKIENKINNLCKNKKNEKQEYEELYFNLECSNDIVNIAKLVRKLNGRCITIDAYKEKDKYILYYCFDIKNVLINIEVLLKNKTINTISSVLKSTIRFEQELSQLYSIAFLGHLNMKEVFLNKTVSKEILNEYVPLSEILINKY